MQSRYSVFIILLEPRLCSYLCLPYFMYLSSVILCNFSYRCLSKHYSLMQSRYPLFTLLSFSVRVCVRLNLFIFIVSLLSFHTLVSCSFGIFCFLAPVTSYLFISFLIYLFIRNRVSCFLYHLVFPHAHSSLAQSRHPLFPVSCHCSYLSMSFVILCTSVFPPHYSFVISNL